MNSFIKIIVVLVVAVLIAGYLTLKQSTSVETEVKKPSIALSTFSLYDIATHISGDTLDPFMILPAGVDAHSFEPTPKLMIKIQESDLVVYSGVGLEPWIANFAFKSKVIDMSKHVKLKELHQEDSHQHGENCTHGAIDPHYWLDIQNMIIATDVITHELIKILPQNKELYMLNREKYVLMLKSLDKKYKTTLSGCKKDMIIVNHNAFSYLASRYGFHVEALSGLSPEAQPSAKNMLRLIEDVKEHDLKTIFFESFVSDKAIKSIANEVDVDVEVLYPLGNITSEQLEKKYSFEDIMKINLQNISKALECQ